MLRFLKRSVKLDACRAFLALALAFSAVSFAGAAYADDASNLPQPASPAKASLEDGKVNVYIGTPRVDGYGIGDSIPVTMVFELTPTKPAPVKAGQGAANAAKTAGTANAATSGNGVSTAGSPTGSGDGTAAVQTAPAPTPLATPRVDVEGLKMQIQSADPLDVEMLTAADSVTRYQRDGKEYLKVVFYVWTFVTTKQTQVDVKADFMYAVDQLADGSPDWHKGSSPVIHIGIRPTAAPNQTTLLEGNISNQQSPKAPAAFWLMLAGPFFILPLFGAMGLVGYRRYMQPKKLSANEEAWALIDPVMADAAARGGLTLEHYKRIFFALRRRYGVLALDGKELFAALKAHADLAGTDFARVELVFGMESVFYAKANEVTQAEQNAFIEGVKLILPRK